MSHELLLPDPPTASDVLVFAQRAARVGEGSVRLVARGGVLVISTAPLAPRTLLDATPTILGMRIVRADPELVCDLVVDAATLRLAGESAVALPDSAVTAPWAGISPPRTGWEQVGEVAASVIAARAQWGIAAVAEALPDSPGEEVVHDVRSKIWGAVDDDLAGLPLGIAFAAHTLGFIAGEETAWIHRAGAWTRVSMSRGHVLVRDTVRSGLTAVRTTRSM